MLLLSADTHLAEGAWARREDLRGDAYFSFSWLVESALNMSIPLIIAGDTVDREANTAHLVHELRHALDRLSELAIEFYYVEGQHERQRDGQSWLAAAHPHAAKGWLSKHNDVVIEDSVRIHGIDWTPREQLPEKLAQVPEDTDILVMHQVCAEFMGDVAVPELTFDQVPYAKVLVIGDYHVQKIVHAKGAQGQDLLVISPGSTCMQSIDEPAEKRAVILHTDFTVSTLLIATREALKPPPITTPEQLDQFVENVGSQLARAKERAATDLPEHMHKPLLWVWFSPELPGAYARIMRAVGDEAAVFTKLLEPDPVETQLETEPEAPGELTLLAALPEEIEDTDSKAYHMAERLLKSANPAATLAELRGEEGL